MRISSRKQQSSWSVLTDICMYPVPVYFKIQVHEVHCHAYKSDLKADFQQVYVNEAIVSNLDNKHVHLINYIISTVTFTNN